MSENAKFAIRLSAIIIASVVLFHLANKYDNYADHHHMTIQEKREQEFTKITDRLGWECQIVSADGGEWGLNGICSFDQGELYCAGRYWLDGHHLQMIDRGAGMQCVSKHANETAKLVKEAK